jgi:hypothetical protein
VTDRPIIFSAPMVRAIIEGRKSQTRRIVKKPAALDALKVFGPSFLGKPGCADLVGFEPFDRLWVRENFAYVGGGDPGILLHAADWRERCAALGLENCDKPPRWTPAIYMPRTASRLTLDVTGVKIERLQAISYDDCLAEGIDHEYPKAKAQFRDLWAGIHGEAEWMANPWVVAVTFTIRSENIDRAA